MSSTRKNTPVVYPVVSWTLTLTLTLTLKTCMHTGNAVQTKQVVPMYFKRERKRGETHTHTHTHTNWFKKRGHKFEREQESIYGGICRKERVGGNDVNLL